MKTCSNGHHVPDNVLFCPVDGERLLQGNIGGSGSGVASGTGTGVTGGSGTGVSTPKLFCGLLGVVIILAGLLVGAVALTVLISFTNKPTISSPPVNTPIPSLTLTNTKTTREILEAPTSTELPSSKKIPTSQTSPSLTAVPISKNKSIGSCPGAIKQQLEVNEDAEICTKKDPVRLRSKPDTDSSIIDRLYPGTIVWVLDGPICSEGASFWKIKIKSGTTGWMMEGLGDREDPYYLCPN